MPASDWEPRAGEPCRVRVEMTLPRRGGTFNADLWMPGTLVSRDDHGLWTVRYRVPFRTTARTEEFFPVRLLPPLEAR